MDRTCWRKVRGLADLWRWPALLPGSTRKGARAQTGPHAGSIGDEHACQGIHGLARRRGQGVVLEDADAPLPNRVLTTGRAGLSGTHSILLTRCKGLFAKR